MKKGLIIALVLLLFAMPLVSAITTTIKSEYKPLETMILKIDGNFIDGIKQDNVYFYSDRIFIPMVYDINKIGDSYYLYALLPNEQKNYTLTLKDVHYLEEGREKTENLDFNFSTKGNVSLFTITPGFVITNKDFSIKITSNKKSIAVKSNFQNLINSINVNTGSEKNVLFSIGNIKNFTITTLSLESEGTKYDIPVEVFVYNNNNATADLESSVLILYPSNGTFYTGKNEVITKKIYLINNGTKDITDLEVIIPINLKNILEVSPNKIDIIPAGNYTIIDMTINSNNQNLSGIITIKNNYYSTEFLTLIKTTGNQTLINQSQEELGSCFSVELNGEICDLDEVCSGSLIKTTEFPTTNNCCIAGECNPPLEEGGSSKIFITIIVILLLLIVFYFIYKKSKVRNKTPERVIKDRTEDYEEKFKPKEVRGNLKKY
jgi:hypothetical protein